MHGTRGIGIGLGRGHDCFFVLSMSYGMWAQEERVVTPEKGPGMCKHVPVRLECLCLWRALKSLRGAGASVYAVRGLEQCGWT